jgi:hypothetical protein
MAEKTKAPPKLTDTERHKRFVDMAREVEASEKLKDFDEAFKKVTRPEDPRSPSGPAKGDKRDPP